MAITRYRTIDAAALLNLIDNVRPTNELLDELCNRLESKYGPRQLLDLLERNNDEESN